MVIIILLILFVPISRGTYKNTGVKFSDSDYPFQSHERSYITLQGMSEVRFMAGEKTQEFKFLNVESNKCIMNVVFTMPNGEILFRADNIKPSFGLKQVVLNHTLEVGTYENCEIEIECFSVTNKSRINGAVMNVTLFVD